MPCIVILARSDRLADDSERWRTVLSEQGPALMLFARQWSATGADAEDAVQNGFLRFWKSRAKARDELAYLYACVRWAAMDLGRRHRRQRKQIVEQRQAPLFDLSADRAQRQSAIEAALNQLPGDQREVVIMKIWGQLTFAQIADALGLPLSTAASRYRYALARLHCELSAEVMHE